MSGKKAFKNHSTREAFLNYKEAIDALNQLPLTDDNKRKQIEIMNLMERPGRLLTWPKEYLEIIKRGEQFAIELGDERNRFGFNALQTFMSQSKN